jgi:hypothetical protein
MRRLRLRDGREVVIYQRLSDALLPSRPDRVPWIGLDRPQPCPTAARAVRAPKLMLALGLASMGRCFGAG